MKQCEQCPSNPTCTTCTGMLGAGSLAKKVLPPREVSLLHLETRQLFSAQLLSISRLAIGISLQQALPTGRYEVELATDYRIIGSALGGLRESTLHVIDIEKVLRKDSYSQRLKLEEFQSWHLSSELEPNRVMEDPATEEKTLLIREELDKLAILHQLEEMYMLMYEAGNLRSLSNCNLGSQEEAELLQLIRQALDRSSRVREQLYSPITKQIYDVHIIPFGQELCGIGMINITDVIAKEYERMRQEWESCKTLLQLFTNGKLELLQDEDLYQLLLRSEKQYTQIVRSPEDLKQVRHTLIQILEPLGLAKNKILHYTVAVNEAASNCLRHSEGGQIDYYVAKQEQVCRIVICDHGQGIMLYELPKAALINGYSTRNSLGAGFHAMLTFADKVLINSSSEGTKIILEIRI